MLADVVLLVHAGVVLFNVGGLLAIVLGAWFGWRWVRNRVFRWTHIGALAFVSVEALLGLTCPLTLLEDSLRGDAPSHGFVARWITHWLYWDLPLWVFGMVYVSVFACALALWRWVPPVASRN